MEDKAQLGDVPRIWCESFKIHSYEAGPSGFATPQSLCRYLQEAASNHAEKLNVAEEFLERNKQMWVLSQLTVNMASFPKWHETIEIKTWPSSRRSGIRVYRDFILYDASRNEIGQASTMWLLLDRETKRPQKTPEFLLQLTSPGLEPDILQAPTRCEFQQDDNSVTERTFAVKGSDIDYNMHVNNVCYLDWALEAIPAEFRMDNFMTELDMQFVKDAKYGENVTSRCIALQGVENNFVHMISNGDNGEALAHLRTAWTKKKD